MKNNNGAIFWFTGLSGSGKTTLASAVAEKLKNNNINVYLLDGDVLRTGLCCDLSFGDKDRKENIRRAGEVAKLFMNEGYLVLCTFISPFSSDRETIRASCPTGKFHEIYISTPIEECERRDPKGLYAKARKGIIPNFTGIDSPYESTATPDLEIDTTCLSVDEAALKFITHFELAIAELDPSNLRKDYV
ncbi:adenylyl-sulfate kinase [Marinomonas piezotolerans]|uniref:Adenylyl-sulfate kinase n=1 Tax=Marinomonas piezotolerans TaxID=2213058 RepID=A0A370U8Y9_9GAMM|nr:adenylyl-sulfate kinase [Marinomonas piezotolerans]RDL44232.1 adenylyl-sulfate kinase [Marinomonas piezotolerans]